MENIEILERLRGYDFFKGIDYTNEFEDRLEKFIIFAGRTRKFQLENGNELNYAIVKKMLNKKNILIKIDENSFYKYKLDEYAKVNIDSIKWRILDDLNIIFKDENIKFTFNKSFLSNLKSFFEENQITEKVDREKKVPITKRLDKYKFPISVATQNSGIYEEYREKLEKFLIVVAKSNLFIVKETKEPITYHTVKYLLNKKGITYNVREEEFNSKSLIGISSYISNNLDILKNEMLEDLNIIFESKKIEFDFATNKDKYPVNKMQTDLILLRDYNFFKVKTGLKEEFEDRLGRLFVIAKNTKIIVYKTSKYDITKNELSYNNIVSLMKKKGLKFQISEIKFGQNTTLGKRISEEFDTMKYQILNDLNTIFKEENIIFELDENKGKEVIEESEIPKKQTISERLEKYKIPLLSTETFARYRENLEKFLMAVAKTHLFMKKKSKEPLTYPIIKELLSKKTLVMQTDKFEFSLKKLSTISPYIYDNLDKIQLMLLEDLNAIYDEDDIEFDFVEYVNKDEFIKSVKYQEKEEKNITSKVEDSIKVENEVEVKNKEVDMLIENSDGKSKLEKFVKILRKYHFRNIRQGLDKEYTDRLEKLFILVGKSKRVLVKNTKQIIDYEVAVSLMKKKGLKFQASKKEYNNGGFPESSAKKFETYKNNIIEDLNILYENEEIEFCLVDDIYSDNVSEKITEKDTEKVIENKVKKNSNEEKISEENQKLKEELENLKQTMEEMKEMFKTIQTDNINQFEKVEFDIPDFIRDMECNDVITVRGNKEYFQKFKRFAILNDIPINLLVNYLFYYAMEELGKKK